MSTNQNPVSAAIWPWPTTPNHSRKRNSETVRNAVRQAVIMVVIGTVLLLLKKLIFSLIVIFLAFVLLFCGIFLPPVFVRFEKAMKRLGVWVGTALTWLLLLPFFYLCFLPGRWLLLLLKKDPLELRVEPDRPSYWTARPVETHVERFKRQY